MSIYFTLDSTGIVLAVNPAGATALGYAVEELLGPISNLFHPEDRAKLTEFTAQSRHSLQAVKGTFRLLKPDGSSLAVKVIGQLLESRNTSPVFLLVCEAIPEPPLPTLSGGNLPEIIALRQPDLVETINKLTALCGQLLGATYALYNRLEQGVLCAIGQWQTPAGYNPLGNPDSHICWEVIQRGGDAPLLMRDLPNTPYAQTDPNVGRYQLKTYLGQAVCCKDIYIGSLCVVYQEDFVPSEAERKILDAIAVGISIAETHQQAEDELTLRHRELLTLHRISEIHLRTQSLKTALQEIVEEVSAATGFPIIAIERYDQPRQMMVFEGSKGIPLPSTTSVLEVPTHQTLSGTVARRGQMIVKTYTPEEAKTSDANETLGQLGIKTFICLPMMVGDRVIGALSLAHPEIVPFGEPLSQWLTSLANYIASLVEYKHVEAALHQQTQRERLVASITQHLQQSLNLEEILNTTVVEVREFLAADRVMIWQLDSGSLVGLAESVSDEWHSMLGCRVTNPWTPEHLEFYQQGNVHAIADLRQVVCQQGMAAYLRENDVKAVVVTPIRRQTELWGLLVAHQCSAPRHWQPTDVELLTQLAARLAIAIQQSELYRQAQRLNADLECQVQARTVQLQIAFEFEATLKRITDRVRDGLDEGQIWQTAVQELARVIGVLCCNAALYNLDQSTSTICYEHTTAMPSSLGCVTQMSVLPEIYSQLLQGESFQFCSVFANLGHGHRAILVCPIFDDKGVLGDLWLINHSHYAFQDQDIRLVQQVANQCAIAIHQARLYQASLAQVEELEKLNRLKDDFLSTVSHELRTPVSNIKMATHMLEIVLNQSGILDSEPNTAGRYFQILQDECQREISLINNLLDLSRLEAGTEPLMLSTIDPKILILSLVEPFIERAREQQQNLQVDVPSTLPVLTTDLSEMGRILTELLNNACKYTPAGETIRVGAHATGDWLGFSVSNSGVEIPERELSRIFDKFYRIPNNNPWKHGGTGLGLALVKRLVEHLGATIQVESAAGQITFTLQIPVRTRR